MAYHRKSKRYSRMTGAVEVSERSLPIATQRKLQKLEEAGFSFTEPVDRFPLFHRGRQSPVYGYYLHGLDPQGNEVIFERHDALGSTGVREAVQLASGKSVSLDKLVKRIS